MKNYWEIKDKCREGLLDYFFQALSMLPPLYKPLVLDAGCGSGVITLALAEKLDGMITAVDKDLNAIKHLDAKIESLNLTGKITPIYASFFDWETPEGMFDLIVAEGFLNEVGFEKGMHKLLSLLRPNGFMIIHDNLKAFKMKSSYFRKINCKLIRSFELDENAWWRAYYQCLEEKINEIRDTDLLKEFESEFENIREFRQNPKQFKSGYYILQKMEVSK